MLVVGDTISKSLVKRGLLKPNFPDDPDAWHRITPAGMRVLADAYEAGQLAQFMRPFPPARKAAVSSAECPLCPGFSTPCGNTNCPQLQQSTKGPAVTSTDLCKDAK
jgi:hypothetical protein